MRIAFSWNGFPQYAARLINAAIACIDTECIVIGSKPKVPLEHIEQLVSCPVKWIDPTRKITWNELGIEIPQIFFQSGWSQPAFCALGDAVKLNGGQIVVLSDANWRGDLRQYLLGALVFKIRRYHKRFDYMFVPGRQGTRLMQYFGIPKDRIYSGLYGADPIIFNGGPPLAKRDKCFLYVGQFIHRKFVLGLVNAFLKFSVSHPDWTLRLVGSGNQRDSFPQNSKILIDDFVQPEKLSQYYHSARFFVLPSLIDAWGLVVHEATLCGCGLILSDAVGSCDDLASTKNALIFKSGSEKELTQSLELAANFNEKDLLTIENNSRTLANKFGPMIFAKEVTKILHHIDAEISVRPI